jgi:hypothetical protein
MAYFDGGVAELGPGPDCRGWDRREIKSMNRSPEPDGAYRYLLRVDPELQPVLGPGSFGAAASDSAQRRRLHLRSQRR